MQNILFIWAKLNPEYSYRQGMNELLAVIVLCVARDSQERRGEDVLSVLVNRQFVEADCYNLFCNYMDFMKQYFFVEKRRDAKQKALEKQTKLFSEANGPQHESPIVDKCIKVFNETLSQVDNELYKHLQTVGVEPNIFLLRWIRLNFCREFHIEDVMFLWDAIFASVKYPATSFVLVDHICCSMLYYVRETLLAGEQSMCLRRLLKFPPVEDIRIILMKSLFLFNPKTGNFAIYEDIDAAALGPAKKIPQVVTVQPVSASAVTKTSGVKAPLLATVNKIGQVSKGSR
jgi:TBC1 domain family protein 5